MGADADYVVAVVVVWLDNSCSIVLSDDEIVLPVYMKTWLMVDTRLVLIRMRMYSYIRCVRSHWSTDWSYGILAREGNQRSRGLSRYG